MKKNTQNIDIKFYVQNPESKKWFDRSSDVESILYKQEIGELFPRIEVKLLSNSKSLAECGAGSFNEVYKLHIMIPDTNWSKIVDSIEIVFRPLAYTGGAVKQIEKPATKINATSGIVSSEYKVVGLIDEALKFSKTSPALYTKKKYKDIFYDYINRVRVETKEIDEPYFKDRFFEQFFIPEARFAKTIPFLMRYGFQGMKEPSCIYYDEKGLRIYRLKKRIEKGKEMFLIIPQITAKDVGLTNEMVVAQYKPIYKPILKLSGSNFRFYGLSLTRNKLTDVNTFNWDDNNEALSGTESEVFLENMDINYGLITPSIEESKYRLSKVRIVFTRIQSFETIKPFKNMWSITFKDKNLVDFTGKYLIFDSKISIDRIKTQFVPTYDIGFFKID